LRIEQYFQQIQALITAASIVQNSSMTYDMRGSFEGYIRGELYLIDGSILHVREYVDVEAAVERLTYAYHYTNTTGMLVFRYDNTDHHRKLNLPTHPHHKHEGSEINVVPSPAPDLATILIEIEGRIQF
jgi:hypothetical protein